MGVPRLSAAEDKHTTHDKLPEGGRGGGGGVEKMGWRENGDTTMHWSMHIPDKPLQLKAGRISKITQF